MGIKDKDPCTIPFDNATKICSGISGSKLFEPKSDAQFKEVRNAVRKVSESEFWIGIQTDDHDKFYYSSDKNIISWTNWDSNEPNNHEFCGWLGCFKMEGEENCVESKVVDDKDEDKWNDKECNTDNQYVCQIPKISLK